jgi:hypothetical protein
VRVLRLGRRRTRRASGRGLGRLAAPAARRAGGQSACGERWRRGWRRWLGRAEHGVGPARARRGRALVRERRKRAAGSECGRAAPGSGGRASLGGGRSRQAHEWLRLGWCGSEQSPQAGPERAARAVAALAQKLEQNARWNRNRCRASRSGCGTARFGSATARAGVCSAGRWRACADAGLVARSETVCASLSAELAVRERAGTRMRRCRRGCRRWCRSGL